MPSSGAMTRALCGALVRSMPACQRSHLSTAQPKGRPPPKLDVANFGETVGSGHAGLSAPVAIGTPSQVGVRAMISGPRGCRRRAVGGLARVLAVLALAQGGLHLGRGLLGEARHEGGLALHAAEQVLAQHGVDGAPRGAGVDREFGGADQVEHADEAVGR